MRKIVADQSTHVCPWWFVRSFDNPVRQLVQDPERVVGSIVRPGDSCVDIGCGIGYFTIPMARLVGPAGSVTAVDLQPEMLDGVGRRAEKAGLSERVRLHRADASGLKLGERFDVALAFWMVHEVPDQPGLFRQIHEILKPGGRLLFAEPKGHVSRSAFARSVECAQDAGFVDMDAAKVPFSRAVVLRRAATGTTSVTSSAS